MPGRRCCHDGCGVPAIAPFRYGDAKFSTGRGWAESPCSGVFISLTTRTHLASVGTVSFRCLKKKGPTSRRLVGVAVLFFVFFLPLHLHFFNSTARVSNECSCYYGARIQAGLAPSLADYSPSLQILIVTLNEAQVFGWFSINSPSVRAPPSFTSL
jgi:hypothetical protein